ncbi:MAG: 50S ribosomal protein L9 [Selenomonadales bacterium]|jgi:large subunit ribosomal protein L9|nr:50S ribosomal protein L9 [Selenomonadales bacterium]MBQ2246222.1 50S ribosomal protein L9 [Selenomonadales bacterium]MBQ5588492.1 50S ribosomal protein L9 [Selenomonadales bacterium]MBQ5637362.1 50S ribosomal protein L9 [Selenomonadales bacterium]MBQ5745506.1 50S ribosomal protein L9 [Selenomonadales bacterium]
MKVILLQDVKKLGKKDDIIEVSEAYARNVLLAKKVAIEATAVNLNNIKQKKGSEARKAQIQAEEAVLLGAQLKKVTVTIPVKIGEGGKLFGSVTGKDVADALEKQCKITIDKRKIEIDGTVRGEGTYTATIKVHPEVTSQVTVNIVKA